jgi:hypothetical protein
MIKKCVAYFVLCNDWMKKTIVVVKIRKKISKLKISCFAGHVADTLFNKRFVAPKKFDLRSQDFMRAEKRRSWNLEISSQTFFRNFHPSKIKLLFIVVFVSSEGDVMPSRLHHQEQRRQPTTTKEENHLFSSSSSSSSSWSTTTTS